MTMGMRGMLRAGPGSHPESTRQAVRNKRDEFAGLSQLKVNQSLLAMRLATLEKHLEKRGLSAEVSDPHSPPGSVRGSARKRS